jgi:hypothetical protein
MGLFKIGADGKTLRINREEFSSEKSIEDLVKKNPEIVSDGEPLLIIGRQVSTDYGTVIDLLGLTVSGDTVIIELKKGMTPREVITQTLEYAVWIQNLGYADLNRITIDNVDVKSLREHYMSYFGESALIENIIENVNREQRLVIIAKEIDKRTEDIARYLREKGIDLWCLKYSHFSGQSGEKYLHVDTIVGKEPRRGAGPELPSVPELYKNLDKVIGTIKSQEFTAPDVYKEFRNLFPDEMAKLEERYRNTPHFTTKTFVARSLISYSKRESAPFELTSRTTQAPADWGYPEVKVYRKRTNQ